MYDHLVGDAGSNRIEGGAGDDLLDGQSGDDFLLGGEGADTLTGGAGRDLLWGREGDDVLDPGAGTGAWQFLFGEAGSDTYRYAKQSGNVFVDHEAELAAAGDIDRIVFADLHLDEIDVSTIDYSGSTEPQQEIVLILGWDDGAGRGELRVAHEGQFVESFDFADGATLTNDDLLALA